MPRIAGMTLFLSAVGLIVPVCTSGSCPEPIFARNTSCVLQTLRFDGAEAVCTDVNRNYYAAPMAGMAHWWQVLPGVTREWDFPFRLVEDTLSDEPTITPNTFQGTLYYRSAAHIQSHGWLGGVVASWYASDSAALEEWATLTRIIHEGQV